MFNEQLLKLSFFWELRGGKLSDGQEEVAKAILTWAQKKMEDGDSDAEKDIWRDAMRGINIRSRKSLGFARR